MDTAVSAKGMWDDLVQEVRKSRDKLPPPPRFVHEKHIQTYRARAYYGELNRDKRFLRNLRRLFRSWSDGNAIRFARKWRLPERGLADLNWSYGLCRKELLRRVRLEVGSRSHVGVEGRVTMENAQSLGYRRHPPRLKNAASLSLGARRLYRRAVLVWPWKQITADEAGEPEQQEDDEDTLDTRAVRDDAHRWAIALGVPLPQRLRGRPPAPAGPSA